MTDEEAAVLRAKWGHNELPEKKKNVFLMFLSYFWGPMPVMIWVAIIVELAKSIVIGEGWIDFAVLMVLQFANAIVGFIEENNAGNAIEVRAREPSPLASVTPRPPLTPPPPQLLPPRRRRSRTRSSPTRTYAAPESSRLAPRASSCPVTCVS